MAITDQLRERIASSGETHYAIGKGANVAPQVLDRFASGERPYLRSDTMDKLCEYFGLELCPKTGETKRKQTGKKTAPKRKRRKKISD